MKRTSARNSVKKPGPKSQPKARAVSRERVIRAVASSTAIETGESIAAIEARLKARQGRFKHLRLA